MDAPIAADGGVRGADGQGFYVIGAHFDSVPQSPGANDHATGVAAVLATARMMTEQECLTRGLIFVFFDQEEDGLVGSRAFATVDLDYLASCTSVLAALVSDLASDGG